MVKIDYTKIKIAKNSKNLKKQAQIFSLDMALAIVIFLVILISGIWLWDYTQEKFYLSEIQSDMESVSRNSLNVLLETSGNPSNWSNLPLSAFNETNVKSIGLAKNEYLILDEDKIKKLINISQQSSKTKKFLGILGAGYDFKLDFGRINGSSYSTLYQIGSNISESSEKVLKTTRYALMNNTITQINFYLWLDE